MHENVQITIDTACGKNQTVSLMPRLLNTNEVSRRREDNKKWRFVQSRV